MLSRDELVVFYQRASTELYHGGTWMRKKVGHAKRDLDAGEPNTYYVWLNSWKMQMDAAARCARTARILAGIED